MHMSAPFITALHSATVRPFPGVLIPSVAVMTRKVAKHSWPCLTCWE